MEKIRSLVNTELSLLASKFFDVEAALKHKKSFEEKLGFEIKDLLNKQKNADQAKKILGKNSFGAVLAIYFNQFETKDGVDAKRLAKDIEEKELIYRRHLGKDKIQFLKLLCRIGMLASEKPTLRIVPQPKGLLFMEAK